VKVAQRLNRIVKNTQGAQFAVTNTQTRAGSGAPPASSSYGEYMSVLREASVPPPEQNYVLPAQNISRPAPFKPQPAAVSAPAPAATASNFCLQCGTRAAGGGSAAGSAGRSDRLLRTCR